MCERLGVFMQSILLTVCYLIFPPLWITAFFNAAVYRKYFKNKVTTFFNCYIIPPCFVTLFFLYFFKQNGIYPFGSKTIAWCDMTQQGVPYWINFKQVLEGDQNLFLNMANASGMDGWSMLRSYFLYPFSYLALFVDSTEIMAFVSLATVLKLAICCVTAMVFFRVCLKQLNPSIAVALSIMYSFCAYGAMYYQILNWPSAMYIMPLYFTGLYILLKEHKIGLFSVTIALIMRNFAFGFMAVIATVLFVGYYLLVLKEDELLAKRNAFDFIVGSVFGAILSLPIWLPFFGAFFGSARGVNVENSLSASNLLTSRYTVYPLLMSTAVMFVAAFALKSEKKKPMEKALYFLFGMMLIAMFFEPINKMWHFGSYMSFPARYAYIVTFCGLALSGCLFARNEGFLIKRSIARNDKIRNIVVVAFSLLFVLCICGVLYTYVVDYVSTNNTAMSAYARTLWGDSTSYKHLLLLFTLALIVYALGYALLKRKLLTKQVFALLLVLVALSEAYTAINVHIIPASNKMNMASYEKYVDLTDRIEDDSFYRVKNAAFLNTSYSSVSEANYPGTLGYNSMGHYSSLTSESYLYAVKAYGYNSVWMKVDTYGGTKFSDALFSVKYSIGKTSTASGDTVYSNDKYCITENDFFLPLGIFTTASETEINVEDFFRIELQEYVYASITGGAESLFTNLDPTVCNNAVVQEKDGVYSIVKKADDAYIEYTIDIKGTKTLYFDCFDNFSNALSEDVYNSFAVFVNGTKVQSKYPVASQNGLLCLGTFTNQTVTVKLNVLKNVQCRSFGLYALDDDLLNNTINNVSCADLTVNGNKICGEYYAETDGTIFVSVPYGDGFKCSVNGKKVELSECFGGFIGVPVTKGENSIQISYVPPTFYSSIIIWVVAIAVIAILAIIARKHGLHGAYDTLRKCIGDKAFNKVLNIAKACVIIAFVAMIVLIYIYPMYLIL